MCEARVRVRPRPPSRDTHVRVCPMCAHQPKSSVLARVPGLSIVVVVRTTVEALSEGHVLCRVSPDVCVWRAMDELYEDTNAVPHLGTWASVEKVLCVYVCDGLVWL
jgi:hypothetical protein